MDLVPYDYPEWSGPIRSAYWHLRIARAGDAARVRKEYRKIRKECDRLEAAGVNPELLRLYCRHMVNPRNVKAFERFKAFHLAVQLLEALNPVKGSTGSRSGAQPQGGEHRTGEDRRGAAPALDRPK
jgi:hypothetical protein